MPFPHLSKSELLAQFERVSPSKYASSRNYLNWAVTRLSPYITHGIVRTPELVNNLLSRYAPDACDGLYKELVWKEYFTQVLVHQWENILSDIESSKAGIAGAHWVPVALDQADTGREWLDAIVRKMQSTGYLHNHERMWIAAYLVHFGKMHWRALADWTHYYFLDGDIAANHLSWQWVASTFSGKPYYFTSENIERYAGVKAPELKGSYEEVWAHIIDPTRVPPFEGQPILADLPPSDLKQYPRVWQLEGENILVLTPWSLDESLILGHKKQYPDSRVYLILDEWFFVRFPMSPARIVWFTQYASMLGAEIVRGNLGWLLSAFNGMDITLEECYQPVYRDAILSARTRPGVKVLAFPRVHPQFGLKYFSRFFWYFASLPNSPELRS